MFFVSLSNNEQSVNQFPQAHLFFFELKISTTEIYLQKVDDNLRGALMGLEAIGKGNLLTDLRTAEKKVRPFDPTP